MVPEFRVDSELQEAGGARRAPLCSSVRGEGSLHLRVDLDPGLLGCWEEVLPVDCGAFSGAPGLTPVPLHPQLWTIPQPPPVFLSSGGRIRP